MLLLKLATVLLLGTVLFLLFTPVVVARRWYTNRTLTVKRPFQIHLSTILALTLFLGAGLGMLISLAKSHEAPLFVAVLLVLIVITLRVLDVFQFNVSGQAKARYGIAKCNPRPPRCRSIQRRAARRITLRFY
jgi:hypothetical protein